VGEFTFVLARAGLVSGSLSPGLYGLVLNTALITMALTPIVAGLTTPVYGWISRRRERDPVQTINLPTGACETTSSSPARVASGRTSPRCSPGCSSPSS